jgi:bifunctional UDP-N-acetylglucosamine pyrophosphorylase/glucosamine-1-phosphate N-acetyltransferase
MSRLLIIPAAGRGSRLRTDLPKPLYPVAGKPLIDYVLDLYQEQVDHIVLVLHSSFADQVEAHCQARMASIEIALQHNADGMLPAILLAHGNVTRHQPDHVWISWCDQIAVRHGTIDRLAQISEGELAPAMTIPTVTRPKPYIHFERNSAGTISQVLQRREHAAMPQVGEGDSGVFCLTRSAYLEDLVAFSKQVVPGTGTGEANFLPFIPWLAAKARVETFPVEHESESIGINSQQDIDALKGHLPEPLK